ncbi:MAG: DAK2 domain-containing protein [Aggregatilineales bacterium]
MITRQAFRDNANSIADGYLIKQLFGAGLTWLEQNKETVNRLNVFPVPDGDTGTNMYLTMRNAYKEIAALEEAHVGRLSSAIAEGALKGARGNSGVILSQIFAGTASVLEKHDKLTAPLLAKASQAAVDAAYSAVEKPVEGTILTVSRKMAEAVNARYKASPDLVALLKRMVFAGRAALRSTPELLPILKKAGVVDSGGQGLVFIFEGMLRALCGKSLVAEIAPTAPVVETWQDALVPEDQLGYGYDVQFLMRGHGMDIAAVRSAISAMGWSTLVVGDADLIKVHVHVHDPGQPLSYAIGQGADLDDIVVENMQRQYEDYVLAREAKTQTLRTDLTGVVVIAVANGDGLKRLFTEQLGAAYVISGGQTMNPSTGEFIDVINALPNDEIILLPNNKNVLLAARQAAAASENKRVRVVPSFTVPQGISAMFEYANLCANGVCDLDTIEEAMRESLKLVRTGEITYATRDAEIDGIFVKAGQHLGLLDDNLVAAADDLFEALATVLYEAQAQAFERITFYYGADASHAEAQALAERLHTTYPNLEFEIVEGGQALYPYIISIE